MPMAIAAANAEDRSITFSWDHDFQQTNGTAIPSDDLLVTVYTESDQEACTGSLTCSTVQPYDTCVIYFAVATQLSTGMQSVPSDGVQSCTGPLPVYDTPPSAPVLKIQLN